MFSLSFAPYAPYPFIRPALNLAAVCIVEPVNCSYKQIALAYPVSPWKLLKVCPLPFPWFLPCRLAVLASAWGVALTWHSGLVLSIKATPCQTSIQCRFWHHESLYHCEWYFDQRANSGSSTKNSYIPCEYNSWAVNLYHSCMRIDNSTFNYTKSKDLAEWNIDWKGLQFVVGDTLVF